MAKEKEMSPEILRRTKEARNGALYVWAYLHASEAVQKIIRDMVEIVMDESSDEQEVDMATETLREVFYGKS